MLMGDKHYAEKQRKGKEVYCKVRGCVILNVIIRVGFIEKEVFEHFKCIPGTQRSSLIQSRNRKISEKNSRQ